MPNLRILDAGSRTRAHLTPAVASCLEGRGVRLEPLAGEAREAFEDRLDTALMALWRDSGDEAVFEELYRHARGRVHEWVRWLLRGKRSSLDALELLQDTFVNVYRYGKTFRDDEPGSFRAWARTIAGNAMRRAAIRGPKARRGQVSMQELPEGWQEPVDPRRGPHLRLVDGEESGLLREAWAVFLAHYAAAYARLSERDQRALRLVEIEGRSYAESGALLCVTPSNMKMIMLRARRRLQKHMRAAMGVEEAARTSASTSPGGARTPRARASVG